MLTDAIDKHTDTFNTCQNMINDVQVIPKNKAESIRDGILLLIITDIVIKILSNRN